MSWETATFLNGAHRGKITSTSMSVCWPGAQMKMLSGV